MTCATPYEDIPPTASPCAASATWDAYYQSHFAAADRALLSGACVTNPAVRKVLEKYVGFSWGNRYFEIHERQEQTDEMFGYVCAFFTPDVVLFRGMRKKFVAAEVFGP